MARVLLVDDDAVVRVAVQNVLSALGDVVVCAPDVRTALALLATADEPFDSVVLDHDLPDGTGAEIAGVLAVLHPRAAVVLHTSRSMTTAPFGVGRVVIKGPGFVELFEALAA